MIGQHIGKYAVLDRIGRGGMGTVYRAVDETLRREVAIKILNAELKDPVVARRFRSEAVTIARLNHPGIATIYELVQHEDQWVMVMEFVRGETLERLVERRGALPVKQAADLTIQTLAALAHAHGLGIVHRDLKPANVMVTESGSVKIMDFGIARVAGTEHLTNVGFLLGTPAYMAPEQVLGHELDARADLYAIAVVLYQLTTARLPFETDSPFEMAQLRLRQPPAAIRMVRADLPSWLGEVMEIALARDPGQRFPTAALFRDALERGMAGLPIEPPGPETVPVELIATAAPGSMPIVIPRAWPAHAPPAAEMPTMMSTPPVPSAISRPPAAPSSSAANAEARGGAAIPLSANAEEPGASRGAGSSPGHSSQNLARRLPLIAAGLVMVLLAGAGWLIHGRHSGQAAASTSVPPVNAGGPAAAASAASGSAPVNPPALPSGSDSAPSTANDGAELTSTATAMPPVAASTTPSGSAPAAALISPAVPASGGMAGVAGEAPAGAGAASGRASRGRLLPTADIHLAFPGVRALVVDGKKADDRPAVLAFGAGQVSLAAEKGGAPLAAMPYGEITYAVHVHARDPKWSVVLAAPPGDVDLPGGLFRSARHWLTLQSRSSFMIVRLGDSDWPKVMETVTARTGIKVEQPAATSN
jgi:serine/threonine protein kinase